MKRILIACVMVLFCASNPVWAQNKVLDPAIEEFLIHQESGFSQGDLVLEANLVSIIPTSRRLIVTTESRETPMALEIIEEPMIKDRNKILQADELTRGDVLILVLNGNDLQVKEIHKFRSSEE